MLLILTSLNACTDNHIADSISGKYVNVSEPDADHYLELNPDSTYIHVYQKDGQRNEYKGTWHFSRSEDEVYFKMWIGFGKYAELTCQDTCWTSAKLLSGTLRFDFDMRNETDFDKK